MKVTFVCNRQAEISKSKQFRINILTGTNILGATFANMILRD